MHELGERVLDPGKAIANVIKQDARPGQIAGLADSFQLAERTGESFYAAGKAGSDQLVRRARDRFGITC